MFYGVPVFSLNGEPPEENQFEICRSAQSTGYVSEKSKASQQHSGPE